MRVLVSPLDWGLGHATRCIPILRALRVAGHEVVIAASGAGLRLLQEEFPDVEAEEFPSYAMRYSRSRFLLPVWLLAQLPLFLFSILRERNRLNHLIQRRGIERVISDGRYGVCTRKVPCVFITHQLCILPPGPRWLQSLFAGPILRLNHRILRGFKEIWVPDFPGEVNLSGMLGHPRSAWPEVRYIFPLCRFRSETLLWSQPMEAGSAGSHAGGIENQDSIEILALVSGPEPQRTVFESLLTRALQNRSGTRVLVRGVPGRSIAGQPKVPQHIMQGKLNVFDHLPGEQISQYLASARRVVCRSGYTSVMELAGMGKTDILFIPTPGQPEQEYLAEHLSAMGFAVFQTQEHLDLDGELPGSSHADKAAEASGFAKLFPVESSQVDRDATANSWVLADWIHAHPLFHIPEHRIKRLAGKFVL